MKSTFAIAGAALILVVPNEVAETALPAFIGLGAYFGIIAVAAYGMIRSIP